MTPTEQLYNGKTSMHCSWSTVLQLTIKNNGNMVFKIV